MDQGDPFVQIQIKRRTSYLLPSEALQISFLTTCRSFNVALPRICLCLFSCARQGVRTRSTGCKTRQAGVTDRSVRGGVRELRLYRGSPFVIIGSP